MVSKVSHPVTPPTFHGLYFFIARRVQHSLPPSLPPVELLPALSSEFYHSTLSRFGRRKTRHKQKKKRTSLVPGVEPSALPSKPGRWSQQLNQWCPVHPFPPFHQNTQPVNFVFSSCVIVLLFFLRVVRLCLSSRFFSKQSEKELKKKNVLPINPYTS